MRCNTRLIQFRCKYSLLGHKKVKVLTVKPTYTRNVGHTNAFSKDGTKGDLIAAGAVY